MRSEKGTPQGGVASPLLANIALSAIEERYERWVDHRQPRSVATPRSTEDGQQVVLAAMTVKLEGWSASRSDTRTTLWSSCREPENRSKPKERTRRAPTVIPYAAAVGRENSGHSNHGAIRVPRQCVRLRWNPHQGYYASVEIPKAKAALLRYRVKRLTGRSTTRFSLSRMLRQLNPLLRGWGNFLQALLRGRSRLQSDRLVRVAPDLAVAAKKHPTPARRSFARTNQRRHSSRRRKVWREGQDEQFVLATLRRELFRLAWVKLPDYAMASGEPDA